ncbi:hypothetical protein F8271_29160 [Micromonospora sp. ALFpr18c]|uniref:hypothetical protein n=1 Tax=unclassified Micromonospora TaxID=2617518 RepID=UPI00124B3BE0|nr:MULTISPECIES: hypothetical protein [unclassified Micromonospora]KAB1928279.1 hypothetical protein F8271_29160 [Micromonospora sp. ALFpr18c]MDG4759652.1 hypothetical protein [Micromonospora sp. WMMD710]
MNTSFRRKAAAVTFAVLALTLAGGGIAVAQPSAKAPQQAVQPTAKRVDNQPPVTAESARKAQAALKAGGATTLVATTVYTVVNSNGTKARGTGTVLKYGPGQYEVQFGYTVSAGAFLATISRSDSCCIPPAGEVSVAPRLSTPNAVFIQTRNSSGTPADLGFTLLTHTP